MSISQGMTILIGCFRNTTRLR